MTLSEQWVVLKYLENCTGYAANCCTSLDRASKCGKLRTHWRWITEDRYSYASWLYNTGRHYNVRKLTFHHKALNIALNYIKRDCVSPVAGLPFHWVPPVPVKCSCAEWRGIQCQASGPMMELEGWHRYCKLDRLLPGYRFVWQNWELSRGLLILSGVQSELIHWLMGAGNVVIE